MRTLSSLISLGVGAVAALAVAMSMGACGSETESTFDSGANVDGGGQFDADPPFDPDASPRGCQGLECRRATCQNGARTTLTGKVYDPSGTVPLYNALVYVPNAPVEPFAPGIACDRCGTVSSGKPIATALTDARGEFVLEDVPVGADVPLVIQIGRWRRQIAVPSVGTCVATPIDKELTRLPRNKGEGDIPRIAITTGNADSLECFVRKLGIDAAEMSNPAGTGRIHLFRGNGSTIDDATPNAQTLWDSAAALKSYDMVILSCEGGEHNETKTTAAKENLGAYLDAGGRVFASHYHYTWLRNGPAPLASTATWTENSTAVGNSAADIDTTFAKGEAFADWLVNVGASTTRGKVPMTELRRSVTTVPGAATPADASRRWISAANAGAEDTKFYSFNTPVGSPPAQQCGRGVFTDIHVSSGDTSVGRFPANCTTSGFTGQEKALLFLLFDLASCVQDEKLPPQPPR